MKAGMRVLGLTLGAWPLAALILGCATAKMPDALGPGPGVKKAERRSDVVRVFDESRTLAEFESAKGAWERGDAKACEESLNRVLTRHGDHREARLLMAEVCLADDRFDEAKGHLAKLLAATPEDAEAMHSMGVALDATGHGVEALAYYQRAAKADPGNELYAIGHRPAAPDECPVVKVSHVATNDSSVSAGSEGAQAKDLDRGIGAIKQGDRTEALAAFRKAIAADPENLRVPIRAAAAAMRANEAKLAVELLVSLKEQYADSAEFLRMLGMAQCRAGDYRASQVALQQALSLDKRSALTYFLMGCTLAKLDERDAAEGFFRQARTIDPRYDAPR